MEIQSNIADAIEENAVGLRTSQINKHVRSASDQNFQNIVDSIKDSYHRDWEKQKLDFARNFLASVWGGIPLPVLSLCGKGTQEIRYTKYLSYFLDGTKPHGLNSRFLDEMMSVVSSHKIDTYRSIIESEKWIGQAGNEKEKVNCYCDVVITCDKSVIFLEQKILSGESANPKSETTQLARYDNAISGNQEFDDKEIIRVFLTPTGKQSKKSPHWYPLSYMELVKIGISVLNKGGISSIARENLRRFLLDILLGPFNKTEDEIQEMVELAEKAVFHPNFSDRLRFDKLISQNNILVKLIMEG